MTEEKTVGTYGYKRGQGKKWKRQELDCTKFEILDIKLLRNV